ncbi:hypothetical protein [Neobacillus kokaensis]|uniref:DUF5668 domain-containing protein n=1 Tax=Neobacillus kokaensis TaxID=2759023 RepID=A0ABQ3N6Q2_9BACI|nr:hypothetical protein [Neobacillus kokaensis]GHI00611.1 hypothetical protein AM1BK_41530 [Neobacillus kokaensis]
MRTWRVGTFSMGILLLMLGLLLFFSRFIGMDLIQVMTAWWPVILIVLGIEILLYLFLARREIPVLKYDFLSIFFVAIIGTLGIAFAMLSSIGLMGKVEEVVAREERSFDLPAFSYKMNDKIHRVVVRNASYDTTIEAANSKEVSLFGTYRVQTSKNKELLKSAKDYLTANQKGDTLYINLKQLPNESGPFYTQGIVAATILIPDDVKLDLVGSNDSLTLKPRALSNDWKIENASTVKVDSSESKDLKIAANSVEEFKGKGWQISKKKDLDGSEEMSGIYQSGEGTYQINIVNSYHVSLLTGK